MRLLLGMLAAVAVAFLLALPAAASCAQPATVAENVARAVVVVYGTVTEGGGGALTFRVDRTLKGQVGGTVRVFVGPGRGGGGGTAVATSVDYPDIGRSAGVGSDHVLYLIRGGDGQLETNACIGSHAGPLDAAELAFFGAGTTPSVVPATPPPVAPDVSIPPPAGPQIWPLLLLAILGATLILFRTRSRLRNGNDLRAN